MALHNRLGRMGEELALGFLEAHGYAVLHRNWRNGHSEVDLIALRGGRLRFVEVKLRSSHRYGRPEQSIGEKKIAFILRAAEAYLDSHPNHTDFRIDVLAITLNKNGPPDFLLIEDVY